MEPSSCLLERRFERVNRSATLAVRPFCPRSLQNAQCQSGATDVNNLPPETHFWLPARADDYAAVDQKWT